MQSIPTRAYLIKLAILLLVAFGIWFSWPQLLTWVISVQSALFVLPEGSILGYYGALAALVTSVTLLVTVLSHVTQFTTLAKSSLQTTLENQTENLLAQIEKIARPQDKERKKELLTVICRKIMRMPQSAERDDFIIYVACARLTVFDRGILREICKNNHRAFSAILNRLPPEDNHV